MQVRQNKGVIMNFFKNNFRFVFMALLLPCMPSNARIEKRLVEKFDAGKKAFDDISIPLEQALQDYDNKVFTRLPQVLDANTQKIMHAVQDPKLQPVANTVLENNNRIVTEIKAQNALFKNRPSAISADSLQSSMEAALGDPGNEAKITALVRVFAEFEGRSRQMPDKLKSTGEGMSAILANLTALSEMYKAANLADQEINQISTDIKNARTQLSTAIAKYPDAYKQLSARVGPVFLANKWANRVQTTWLNEVGSFFEDAGRGIAYAYEQSLKKAFDYINDAIIQPVRDKIHEIAKPLYAAADGVAAIPNKIRDGAQAVIGSKTTDSMSQGLQKGIAQLADQIKTINKSIEDTKQQKKDTEKLDLAKKGIKDTRELNDILIGTPQSPGVFDDVVIALTELVNPANGVLVTLQKALQQAADAAADGEADIKKKIDEVENKANATATNLRNTASLFNQ